MATPGEYNTEPSLELPKVRSTFLKENTKTVPKKIGFICMGRLGQIIVKHLLNSGHDVSIWNQDVEKCLKSVEAGAHLCLTPSEVVRNTDIIFSCVSRPDIVKSLFYHEEGVLQGFKNCKPGTKGYVELTFMDSTSSNEIAKAIMDNGGKYLEAPIYDSGKRAEEGSLPLLCSGDLELFKECKVYFTTFSEFQIFDP
ncbi:putative oxidoreductase GLYR1 homolog [Trichonephila clavipes]|nr:putative oxidoreductase GLYR1 homolog [Trichonephila clavipes]